MGKSSKKTGKESETLDTIPLEMSREEYDDLVSQVEGLTVDDAKEELLDCSRYGEVDVVRAILAKYESVVDSADDSGNTALHKACANGHVSTTKLLLQRGASHLPNESGNTPLHWAASSGHEEVVKLILSHEPFKADMDVLQKNAFGRSALTEGFSSKNTLLVKLLLEHDSATEEKLLSGGKEVEDEDGSTNPTNGKTKTAVTHEFDFRTHPKQNSDGDAEHVLTTTVESTEDIDHDTLPGTLRIRELPMAHADDPFGSRAIDDTTGYSIWCASLAMARWMASDELSTRFAGKTVLELGAGCGVPGLAAALYSNARKVYVTDLNPTTVRNLQYNIKLNKKGFASGKDIAADRVVAMSIDWDDETSWPTEKIDYVIGSDLIYQADIVPLLKKVVLGLLKPNEGRFLYVAPDTGRDGLPEFIESMKSEGCQLVKESVAPPSYHGNPLSNRDDDECFLHFHELSSSTFVLYEFQCS